MNIDNLKLLRSWAENQRRFPRPHSFLSDAFNRIAPKSKQQVPKYKLIFQTFLKVIWHLLVFKELRRWFGRKTHRFFGKPNYHFPQSFFDLQDETYQRFQMGSLFKCPHCYDWRKSGEPKIEEYIEYIDYLISWEENRVGYLRKHFPQAYKNYEIFSY